VLLSLDALERAVDLPGQWLRAAGSTARMCWPTLGHGFLRGGSLLPRNGCNLTAWHCLLFSGNTGEACSWGPGSHGLLCVRHTGLIPDPTHGQSSLLSAGPQLAGSST
jgi:hypothetical protein